MKIQAIMTKDVATCRPDTDLAAVAVEMWHRDCGFVPIVDGDGTPVGVVTDRDICIAAATRGLTPTHLPASAVMSRPVRSCLATDEVADALAVMKQFQVRRLPVTDASGRLSGVVSLNDLILASRRSKGLPAKDVLATLAAVCAHHHKAPAAV